MMLGMRRRGYGGIQANKGRSGFPASSCMQCIRRRCRQPDRRGSTTTCRGCRPVEGTCQVDTRRSITCMHLPLADCLNTKGFVVCSNSFPHLSG